MKKKTDKYVVPGKKPKKEEPKKKCNCMVCQHSREFHRIVGSFVELVPQLGE